MQYSQQISSCFWTGNQETQRNHSNFLPRGQRYLKLDLYLIPLDLSWRKNFSVWKKEGVIKSVSHNKWASTVVPVVKKNGQVRLSGDYYLTINPVMKVDQYPLPHITDGWWTKVFQDKT